jgi:hypothetical protein
MGNAAEFFHATSYEERMALRNALTFAGAQASYENRSEPEVSDDDPVETRLQQIAAAREALDRAESMLTNRSEVWLSRVDALFVEAVDCLLTE